MAVAEARSTRSYQSRSYHAQTYSSSYGSASAQRSVYTHRASSALRATRPAGEREYASGTRSYTRGYPRTQLRLIERNHAINTSQGIMDSVRTFASNRRASSIMCIASVVCFALSLFGSLMLNTMMVQNAYSISQTQNSVTRLTQDVQQDKAKLNSLEAQLPQRATQMGMKQGTTSMTIDMGNTH